MIQASTSAVSRLAREVFSSAPMPLGVASTSDMIDTRQAKPNPATISGNSRVARWGK